MPPILRWGLPSDVAAWAALGVGFAVWLTTDRASRWIQRRPRTATLALAVVAASLSTLYVHYYLGGAPRIIDATSYYLEARGIAQGAFSMAPLEPSGSFRGRFLTGPTGETSLSVIFPPGYPTLLALGFLVGQPMLVGPLLAFALVCLTYHLAQKLTDNPHIALIAACLSTLSGTLRYHSADTMSHAWAAVLLTVCLAQVVSRNPAGVVMAGLASGWLIATRPVTGALSVVLGLLWLLGTHRFTLRTLISRCLPFCAALLPGVVLLVLHQHAATGEWLGSSQLHYYALADGPPGCFKYGFGASVGCLHEHAEVAARLQGEFGISDALKTTVHRLHWHLVDIANFELLALLVPYAVFRARANPKIRLAAMTILGIIVAYAPFYFNGSYPAGGARFFADVLPVEHVLVALALHELSKARLGISLSLCGFALHASFSHQALAQRDGGQPMYSERALLERGIRRGLVLVNTDHGFNIGFDPSRRSAHDGVVIARLRGDAHDRVLWERLERPKVYHYRYLPWSTSPGPFIESIALRPDPVLRFEAEAEWPPLSVNGGYALPSHVGADCASSKKALKLRPLPGQSLEVELEFLTLSSGLHYVDIGWVKGPLPGASFVVQLRGSGAEAPLKARAGQVEFQRSHCATQRLGAINLPAGPVRVLLSLKEEAWLDFVEVGPPSPSKRPVPQAD